MTGMLSEIDWNENMIIMALIFGLPIVTVIAGAWYKISRHQSDNELKRAMVQRGMSAEEIERVLAARPTKQV